MMGRIHSLQSLGGADGPGLRYVVFTQGCPLRCGCCHNPDTWDVSGGTERSAQEVFGELLRYREYFGEVGGLTISGGEPLLQPEFCRELFSLCRGAGISTCLDTSGCILNPQVKELLAVTDLVLLDIKYTTEDDYRRHVGCSLETVLQFLGYLRVQNIKTWLRQVSIEGINDTEENIKKLSQLRKSHENVEKIELLPFRTLCTEKYERMGIPFPFQGISQTGAETMERLGKMLKDQ